MRAVCNLDAQRLGFALNHGRTSGALLGTGDIAASARQPAGFVDRVRAATGATKVDLLGHSQGGMMPSSHGTTFSGLGLLAPAFPGGVELLGPNCKACEQQLIGSDPAHVQRPTC